MPNGWLDDMIEIWTGQNMQDIVTPNTQWRNLGNDKAQGQRWLIQPVAQSTTVSDSLQLKPSSKENDLTMDMRQLSIPKTNDQLTSILMRNYEQNVANEAQIEIEKALMKSGGASEMVKRNLLQLLMKARHRKGATDRKVMEKADKKMNLKQLSRSAYMVRIG